MHRRRGSIACMISNWRVVAVGLLVVPGCTSALGFGQEFDKLKCERQFECAQGAFDALYTDVGACRDELDSMSADYFVCAAENCRYDGAQARGCLHDVRSGDCDDIVNGTAWANCNPADVFVACDVVALANCLGG